MSQVSYDSNGYPSYTNPDGSPYSGKGKYGPYGSTPPPGMVDPTTQLKGGVFGLSFGDPEGIGPGAGGFPNFLKGAFPQTAGYISQGSNMAQQSMLRGFEEMYRHKAQGIAAGQSEMNNRMGGEVASQQMNPDLVRRMLLGGNAQAQAGIGSAYGESKAGYYDALAGLQKNTATEFAQLKQQQIQMLLQAYLAKQARKAGSQAGLTALGGSALGAAGMALGGPGGYFAGQAASQGLEGK
jgi:hypothetical protein